MFRVCSAHLRILGLAVLTSLAFAGSSLCAPQWLKNSITASESVTVEKDVPALVIYHATEVEISKDGTSRLMMFQAIKVLTSAGMSEAVMQEGLTESRKVSNVRGWRIEPTGKEHKLDDKNITEIGIPEAAGYYDEFRTLEASFPDARTGDIIAYEYDVQEKDYWDGFNQSFVFQYGLPVVASHFKVTVPDGWQLHISSQNIEPVNYTVNANIHDWGTGFIPARPPEPLMPAWGYVQRSVSVNCYSTEDLRATHFANWRKAALWAMELHRLPDPIPDSLIALANQLCQGLTTRTEKLEAIADYVRDKIRYVAVEIGEGRFRPRDPLRTCVNTYGDCKDKAQLMRALLAAVGIPARSVLAKLDGPVDKDFPNPFQFNHVIVAVPLDSIPEFDSTSKSCANGSLFFDPTDEATALRSLPAPLQGSQVLVISATDSALTTLPQLNPEDRFRRFAAVAQLDGNYHLSAQVTITDYHHGAADVRLYRMHQPVADQIKNFQQLFSESMQNAKLNDFQVGDNGDSVWATFNLSGDYSVTQTGSMCLIKSDFFHPDQPDDFIRDERVYPIYLGSTGQIETDISWRFPEGWTVDPNVENIEASCKSASVTSVTDVSGDTAHFRSKAVVHSRLLGPDEYNEARNYDQKYRAANRMRTILVKK